MTSCTDVHAHIFPLGLPDVGDSDRWPRLERRHDGSAAIVQHGRLYRMVDASYWEVEPRLRWMDRVGVTRQVVSPLPILLAYWAAAREGLEFARRQNEAIAAFVAQAPSRLVGFGTVPLQDPELAAGELDNLRSLGLAGVEIGTRGGERELNAPDMRTFFARAAELGLPVLLHAQEAAGLGRMGDPLVRFGIGVPTDAGIAATMIYLSGLLSELPHLRLCACHGGGSFLWSLPRLRPLVRASMGIEALERLDAALGALYVDTASLSPDNVDYVLRMTSSERLLLGSDFPATQARSPLDALDTRHDGVRTAVLSTNAARYLDGPSPAPGSMRECYQL